MNRREFLAGSLAAMPVLAGLPLPLAGAARRRSLALTTADHQAHVVAVAIATGRIRKRIATPEDPRSIEHHGTGPAVVANTGSGAITLIDPRELRVTRVLHGFSEPRYTAIGRGGRVAYVTDSGTGELAVVDLERRRVLRRVTVGAAARHLTRSPDGRTLWVSLGSSAATIVIVDVTDVWHPRIRGRVHPPFLAHDVGFSPSGRRVWVTAGREAKLAIYRAHGHGTPQLIGADAAPQHITFGPTFAYVTSGNGASMRMHQLSGGAVRRTTKVPLGAYNVQRGAGHVLTPSLGDGSLTILDPHGRIRHHVQVAAAAHDVCVVN